MKCYQQAENKNTTRKERKMLNREFVTKKASRNLQGKHMEELEKPYYLILYVVVYCFETYNNRRYYARKNFQG